MRDLQNTPFAGSNFYIYAGPGFDSTAPTVTSVAPAGGSTGVGINASVRISFSEPMNPLTLGSSNLSLGSASGPIPASVFFNGDGSAVTLVPQAPLPDNAAITITLTAAEDVAGHPVSLTSLFTTAGSADTQRATVISSNIAYGASDVAVNSPIKITFDEQMDSSTVLSRAATLIYDTTTNIYVVGTMAASPDSRTYTFVPSTALAVNRGYYVQLSGSQDLAGNTMNGFFLTFTTTFAADVAAPTIVATTPSNGASGVVRNAVIQVLFSEAMAADALGGVTFEHNGVAVPFAASVTNGNRTLNLVPSTLLQPSFAYAIGLTGLTDTSGNPLAPATIDFTTGTGADLVAPTILTFSPAYGDSAVPLNVRPRAVFSEPINRLSIAASNFRIANTAGGPYVDATVSLSGDARTVTLTPDAPLSPQSQCLTSSCSAFRTLPGIPAAARPTTSRRRALATRQGPR